MISCYQVKLRWITGIPREIGQGIAVMVAFSIFFAPLKPEPDAWIAVK